MKQEHVAVAVKVKARPKAATGKSARNEVSRDSLIAAGAVAATVGIWAVICAAGAVMNSDGPLAMVKGLANALLGL